MNEKIINVIKYRAALFKNFFSLSIEIITNSKRFVTLKVPKKIRAKNKSSLNLYFNKPSGNMPKVKGTQINATIKIHESINNKHHLNVYTYADL